MSSLAPGKAGNIQDKVQAYQAVCLKPLLTRVARELRLNLQDASSLVREYTLFLDLKVLFEDWDPKKQKLLPPAKIDSVWHLHVLDTKRYGPECDKLCGRIIHHNPDTTVDIDRKERYERTLNAYRDAFKIEPPADIWVGQAVKLPAAKLQPTLPVKAQHSPQPVQAPKAPNSAEEVVPYMLYIKETKNNLRMPLSVGNARTVRELKELIGLEKNICTEFEIIFAGRVLSDDKRMSDYNMHSEDTIYIVPNVRGC